MKKGEFNTPIREKYIYRDKHSKKNWKKKHTSHLQIRHFEMKERMVLKALFTNITTETEIKHCAH